MHRRIAYFPVNDNVIQYHHTHDAEASRRRNMYLTVEQGIRDPSTLRFSEAGENGRDKMRIVLGPEQEVLLRELLATEAGKGLLEEIGRAGMRLQSLSLMRSFATRP